LELSEILLASLYHDPDAICNEIHEFSLEEARI